MKKCPHCQSNVKIKRAKQKQAHKGIVVCTAIANTLQPDPKQQGYPESTRKKAAEMYVDGGNLRRIARHLKIAPRTVALWVTDVAEALPNAPMPDEVKEAEIKEAEMDEIFTFIGDKKTESTF